MVWDGLAQAIRELLGERDYDAITMGHIAERTGLARNTLYNYGRDKSALILALTERAGRPTVAQVAATARSDRNAADRMREIIAIVLEAFRDPALQLMFRPGSLPNPFHAIVAEVENVVRDGIARGEFHQVADVSLAVELLSGVMRAGAERIGRDPSALAATTGAAREIILAGLTR